VAFLDNKLGPAEEDELSAEETLAVEDTELKLDALDTTLELALIAIELVALDITDATALEFAALEATETAELEITDATELVTLELAVDAALDTDDANILDAAEVAGLDEGVSECPAPLLFPPPHATRLHKVMLHKIARAPSRRRKPLDINMDVSELL